MTQDELDTEIISLQFRVAAQTDKDLIVPACYGQFNNPIFEKKALLQNQILKALWRFKIDPEQSCSCLTEAQVVNIITFLKKEIPAKYIAPANPITTTITDSNIQFIFNLLSLGCDKACVGDYNNIRVTFLTSFGDVLAQYTLDDTPPIGRHLEVIDKDSVGAVLYADQMPATNQGLYFNFEVEEDAGVWLTIVENSLLTTLKQY